jgi:hypothetical protein
MVRRLRIRHSARVRSSCGGRVEASEITSKAAMQRHLKTGHGEQARGGLEGRGEGRRWNAV